MLTPSVVFPGAKFKKFDHPWLAAFVAALDERLRLRNGVVEYTDSPDCLFRIQVARNTAEYVLSDGTCLRPGDRVINLHLWNEQFPVFDERGPTLIWARTINRAFDLSLRELAQFVGARPDLKDVVAICGNMALASAGRTEQLARIVARFGFEPVAACGSRSIRRHMHELGENILISMMVLARNAAALHADTLARDRTLVLLSRKMLDRRYGLPLRNARIQETKAVC